MFVHLHNHTHYSLLDAVAAPEKLISAAIADDQKALAITDHGVMFGCFEFYRKAKEKGIKPLIGVEAYVAVRKHTDRERVDASGKQRNYYHLVLLAKNDVGYKNLVKLTSIGHSKGFYYKPRIDFDLLREHHEGIIATSACLAGPINAPLLAGDFDLARANAILLRDIFGADFYVELQDHGLPQDKTVLEYAPKLAKELGIKLVVTNDTHYVKQEHAVPHNVMLHITKDAAFTRDTGFDVRKDLRYRVPEMYLKTQEQMKELFKAFPEGIESTVEIAEKINLEIPTQLQMPQFPIPADSQAATLEDHLEELTMRGIEERYPVLTSEILDRTHFELNVIRRMGFAGYFLIVADFIRAAWEMGVRVGPGRGSAAGSIVAYALKITNVDPLKYDLLFERFLNPERVSMPDIDVDFSDDKRELVLDYVKNKYGAESVAQIITFGTLSSRAVIKDVGRVLGIDLTTVNSITNKIPVIQGKPEPLSKAFESPELRWLKNSDDERLQDLMKYSLVLEGCARNSSTHAAGVVIAPGPISDYVPVYQTPNTEPATQYTMKELENAGLLKMDFLGLRTLSILDNTFEQIKRRHGIDIDIDAIPLDDKKVFEMFGRGQTTAVFQFESEPMQDAMRKLQPESLEDLVAMNALYRPGPMANIPDFIDRKHGRKPIEYLHPLMEPILARTYGVIVYQEQVMQLVQSIAGFTLAQSDLMRRLMSKKDVETMKKQRAIFVEGAEKTNGIPADLASTIYDSIQAFAGYGFNKSHSVAYAYLAYQTAWLKTYYPSEFLAANMTAEIGDQARIVSLIEEARRYNITVLPPDVNKSFGGFIADDSAIFFGMGAIKNVGLGAVDAIVAARNESTFTSIFDFAARVDSKVVNKRVLEALVAAGAFDSMRNGHRAQLFSAIEPAIEYARKVHSTGPSNMDSLFGDETEIQLVEPTLPPVDPWPELERLHKEKEYLNFYVSGHPLQSHSLAVQSFSSIQLSRPDPEKHDKSGQRICGLVTNVRTKLDKQERTMAFVQVEQYVGSCECVMFNDAYSRFAALIKPDAVLVFVGKADVSGQNVKLIVDEVYTLDQAVSKLTHGYVIRVNPEQVTEEQLVELRSMCNTATSNGRLTFTVVRPDGIAHYSTMSKVTSSPETSEFLVRTFGAQNVYYDVDT
ncbi:MAG: DNA polymerase III subunit alpha [Bradyrhizobiaceae bacterium]|nr:DNA polymerase III subunit alpha [Bradyrhizobiaceae bacterium]